MKKTRYCFYLLCILFFQDPCVTRASGVEDLVEISNSIKEYCQYWMLKEYSQMYTFLSPDAQEAIRLFDFMNEYESTENQARDVIRHTIMMVNEYKNQITMFVKIDFWSQSAKKKESLSYVFDFMPFDEEWKLMSRPYSMEGAVSARDFKKAAE